jgi:hypothetical protein
MCENKIFAYLAPNGLLYPLCGLPQVGQIAGLFASKPGSLQVHSTVGCKLCWAAHSALLASMSDNHSLPSASVACSYFIVEKLKTITDFILEPLWQMGMPPNGLRYPRVAQVTVQL